MFNNNKVTLTSYLTIDTHHIPDPSVNCYDTRPRLCVSSLRTNEDYIFYYINLARIPVTGVVPLVSLCLLNYLVYMKLVRRRKAMMNIGEKKKKRNNFPCGALFLV